MRYGQEILLLPTQRSFVWQVFPTVRGPLFLDPDCCRAIRVTTDRFNISSQLTRAFILGPRKGQQFPADVRQSPHKPPTTARPAIS